MPRKKLPKQRQKSRLLRILISPTEFKAWQAESKAKHDGVLSAFVRERVNASLDAHEHPTLVVSGDLAERIVKSGRTADALVCDALDRAEADPSRDSRDSTKTQTSQPASRRLEEKKEIQA